MLAIYLGLILGPLLGAGLVAFERESPGMRSLYPPFGGYKDGGSPNRFESYNRRQLEWVHAAIRRRVMGAREGREPYRTRE